MASTPEDVIKNLDAVLDVWKEHPDILLHDETDKTVTFSYADILKRRNDQAALLPAIASKERELGSLKDGRDDESKVLDKMRSRGLSAFRGLFGANSTEYNEAGGTRDSERKPRGASKSPKLPKQT